MSALADASASQHPGMFKVMMQLMKLRVIVLLQITAICAILVHDTFARYGVMDVERTWADTFAAMLITVVGGTLSAGGSNSINMWYDADIDPHMRRTMNRPVPLGHATPRFALVFGSFIAVVGSALFLLISVKAAFWSAFPFCFMSSCIRCGSSDEPLKTSLSAALLVQPRRLLVGRWRQVIASLARTCWIWAHPFRGCSSSSSSYGRLPTFGLLHCTVLENTARSTSP